MQVGYRLVELLGLVHFALLRFARRAAPRS
jgi:hypothetical protein